MVELDLQEDYMSPSLGGGRGGHDVIAELYEAC
jgi:hypothetical protein